ncbi:MAG: hypothetical protein WDZ94_05635 [Patescibacteria group bacterium]
MPQKKAHQALPSTRTVLTEIAQLLRENALKILILLSIISILSYFIPSYVNFGAASISIQKLGFLGTSETQTASVATWIAMLLTSLILLVTNLAFIAYYNIVLILATAGPAKKSLSTILLEGVPLVLPYLTTAALFLVLFIGGLGFFIIPGLLFIILFTLFDQVVIFGKERNSAALTTAATLFWRNKSFVFRYLVISALVVVSISVINTQAYSYMQSLEQQAVTAVARFFNIFMQAAAGTIMTATSIVVYRHIVRRTDLDNTMNLTWIKVMVVIGLLLVGLLATGYLMSIAV